MLARFLASAIALTLAVGAHARWAMVPTDTPVEPLLAKYRKLVQKNPRDWQSWYVLGRVHSMAYATGEEKVAVRKDEQGAAIFPGFASIRVPYEANAPMSPARRDHLNRSISAYARAAELQPKNALVLLGLGWMHEMAAKDSAASFHRQCALKAYRSVVRLRLDAEQGLRSYGIEADSRLALEAAEGIIRLLVSRDSKEAVAMANVAKRLKAIPQAISPIVVPLNGETTLSQLLSGAKTRFDVAGDGVVREWEWVGPTTGILCWDPRGTGEITSGRQLFGHATWWLFFQDGYQALASLDADGDGRLQGGELRGICVWQDLNTNGVSDPGEVRSLAAHGITGLGVVGEDSGGLMWAREGVTFADGRFAPSFDWVPKGTPVSRR